MTNIIKLPFGTGEAIITGTFIPEEREYFNHKEGYGLPGSDADFEIEKFEVGGVDIVEELVGLEVPRYVGAIDNTRYSSFLEEFVAKHWDSIYKQCVDEEI
jgi:hypothetical protein